MSHDADVLDLIERAMTDDPSCPVCGAPNTVHDEADGCLSLVCSATVAPTRVMDRVSAAMLPHTRRHLIDLTEFMAA